ncbi:helix-turn-helix domain-containing protein [Verrucomicrobium spinosum]|uniref:helix-turn-helix domain-containing protein n=1 Tax=Verrucomicrobium spinosum TaxID=2736 RepID=UPI0002E6179D|nr:AraC family transcriptional regulator [Verrucomicrobium spinosum]
MHLVVEKPSPLAASELVACEVVRGDDFGCVWHHHPECEITLVLRGGTERMVGDKLTRLRPGDLTLLGPDLPHDYRNEHPATGRGQRVQAIVVQFMPDLLGKGWLQHASMQRVRQLFHRSRLGLEVRGPTRRRAALRMKQLSRATGLRRVVLLLEILEDLAVSRELVEIASPGFHAPAAHGPTDRVAPIIAHIESHLATPLHVRDLALMAGLSESAFSRLFKKSTGRSVPQYLNELRIGRACRLLAETDDTVARIATACGYPSPANFQRQFHRHQQRSPLAYRAAVRARG